MTHFSLRPQHPYDDAGAGSPPYGAGIAGDLISMAADMLGKAYVGDELPTQIAIIAARHNLPDLVYLDMPAFHHAASALRLCVDLPQPGDIVLLSYHWKSPSTCGIVISVAGRDVEFVACAPLGPNEDDETEGTAIHMNLSQTRGWRVCAIIRL